MPSSNYKDSQERDLWETLFELAERAGLRRTTITKWLGASPAQVRAVTTPAMKQRYVLLIQSLTQCIRERLSDGTLPIDAEFTYLQDLYNDWLSNK